MCGAIFWLLAETDAGLFVTCVCSNAVALFRKKIYFCLPLNIFALLWINVGSSNSVNLIILKFCLFIENVISYNLLLNNVGSLNSANLNWILTWKSEMSEKLSTCFRVLKKCYGNTCCASSSSSVKRVWCFWTSVGEDDELLAASTGRTPEGAFSPRNKKNFFLQYIVCLYMEDIWLLILERRRHLEGVAGVFFFFYICTLFFFWSCGGMEVHRRCSPFFGKGGVATTAEAFPLQGSTDLIHGYRLLFLGGSGWVLLPPYPLSLSLSIFFYICFQSSLSPPSLSTSSMKSWRGCQKLRLFQQLCTLPPHHRTTVVNRLSSSTGSVAPF